MSSKNIDEEIRNRIRVAVYAYAYEFMDDPLVSDGEFDDLCKIINPQMSTSYETRNNSAIDKFFREEFNSSTGSWVWKHPDKEGLDRYYRLWKK